MKALVTGSSGFIGSALISKLRENGERVGGIDLRLPRWRPRHLDDHFVDITDGKALSDALKTLQPEAVVNLAARTDVSRDPVVQYHANIEGVVNLLRAAQAAGTVRRVLWVSTQLVSRVGRIPKHETDFDPDTSYGESKVIGERVVRGMEGGGMEWAILRPTTVWGPEMSDHYLSLLRYLESRRYFHAGGASVPKSFSYIGNAISQIRSLLIAPAEQVIGQTFYIADYQPIDMRGWCDDLSRALGAPVSPVLPTVLAALLARCGDLLAATVAPGFKFNSFRLRNIMTPYVFNTDNLMAITGALPFDARSAILETVRWYREVSHRLVQGAQ